MFIIFASYHGKHHTNTMDDCLIWQQHNSGHHSDNVLTTTSRVCHDNTSTFLVQMCFFFGFNTLVTAFFFILVLLVMTLFLHIRPWPEVVILTEAKPSSYVNHWSFVPSISPSTWREGVASRSWSCPVDHSSATCSCARWKAATVECYYQNCQYDGTR